MLTASLVTYQHRIDQIRPTIESILRSDFDLFYIIDNSALPEFQQEIAALENPKIIYIPSENRGFGAGHNQAIRRAMEMGSDFHAIVNPDIYFDAGMLEKIRDYMVEHPEIGLIMPKTIYPDGTMQYNCKLVPTPFDLIFKRFLPSWLKDRRMYRFTMQFADYESIMDVPYLCGCFMVFQIKALCEVGLFDERFFMYPEDIDITRRIHRKFRTVYYPAATVIHAHEAASYKSTRMLKIHICNMIKYFNKWGWFIDPERSRINQQILATHNQGK